MGKQFNNTIKKEFADERPGHVTDAKYFYFENIDKSADIAILCGGYEQCAGDFYISRENFPFFVTIFTIGGEGVFEIYDRKYPLSCGSLLAFGPNHPYKLIADRESPMEQYFLIFSGERAEELLAKSRIEEKGSVRVRNYQAVINNFKQILGAGLDQQEFAHEICCCYLKAVLLEQSQREYEGEFKSTSYENFLHCKNFLENNFTRIRSSGELADNCGLNVRYIARLFRRYAQVRPYEHLMNLKMNKAANLLLTTNFNINQISAMTGIDDPYHFSRIFKKKFKVSPSVYRKHFMKKTCAAQLDLAEKIAAMRRG